MLAASVAAAAVIFVFALGEIPVTAKVNPPQPAGQGPLALTLLNDMHYQRPQAVMVAALAIIVTAALAAAIVAAAWRLFRPRRDSGMSPAALLAALIPSITLIGCDPVDEHDAVPLDPILIFGSPGLSPGQMSYPRAIDVDRAGQWVYVIEKSPLLQADTTGARIQRFGFDGKPQCAWRTPEHANGRPTGISVAPDGRIFVPDTHYYRVLVYDSEGSELMRFGEFGTGPGQFIFVTDVAFGPEGRLYVSEYGGNDRVQVFSPDGHYLFGFGSLGQGDGQFSRPQAMVFNADKTELFIADSCNFRIVVVDPQGKFLRSFGTAGHGPGQFTYPYGIEILDDGTLIVCEFGGARIQHLDARGKCLGIWGRVGRGAGELQYPWAVAVAGDRLFVLDSGNNRVQVVRTP
jgi:sugar lactone lactonase YvrE